MGLLSRLAGDLRSDRTAPADATATLAMRMVEHRVPGVGVVLVRGGQIAEVGCFGAIRAGGPFVSAGTLFQAASISKLVAALVTLRLVDAGRLDLDADVGKVLKGRMPSGDHRKAAVTLRRLLNHSAGTTVHGFPGYAPARRCPRSRRS